MPAQPVYPSTSAQQSAVATDRSSWLSIWLKTAMLLLLAASSGVRAAPPTMELFAGGGNTTATGPLTASQTNTYAFNLDNPSSNIASATYFPKTAVTYSLENQQYTGTLANTGLVFGGDGDNIYIPLSGQGSPTNTDFTSSRLNANSGTGIDTTNNYGTRFLLRAGRLDGNSTRRTTTVNSGLGYYFGDIVVTWNKPVFNPIINISGLGGTSGGSSSFGFAAQFQLSSPPSGTTIGLLSGRNIAVSGNNITNTAGTIGANANAGGSSGSIQVLNDSPITSLRFRVYVRSDSTSTSTSWISDSADAFVFSASSVDSTVGDLYVSKTNSTSSVVQGTTTTYTVRVTNAGPSTIATPVLKDISGAGLTPTGVVCSSVSGNKCTTAPTLASLTSGITIASLASGEFYEVLVTSNVTATSGNVVNTATIELPNFASSTGASCVTSGGITRSYDQATGTCTSTDTDTIAPTTDLAITKTGTSSVKAGQPVSYSIKVWNKGPVAVTNAVMTDNVPANISGVYIRCVATGTATCGTVTPYTSGSNSRTATGISLPVDSTGNTNYVTYTVSGLAYQTGSFTNTATISSATITDIDSSDNSASQATTITTDAAVTTGNAANQCLASQASNIITALPFAAYDSDNATQTANLTISNTGTGYGVGTNGAIVVNGKINWSYGSPRITGATMTIYINGTAYAVLTTVGASSNPSQATWTALNGASITPATVALGSYGDGTNAVPFSLTLPTSITSVTAGYIEFKNISPAGAGSVAGDDIGVAVDSILQCRKPIIRIAKLSTGSTGTFGFSGLTNLSSANGSAVTTDSVTTTTAGTAATSGQTNYAIANATDINITENTSAAYTLTAASCTDANSATTGNTGSFGSLSGNSLTVPAATIKYGANITCTFNNVTGADLAILKTGSSSVAQGNTVSYSIKVWNKGPVVASSSTFADNVPTTLTNVIWNCAASGSANCGNTSSGTGNNISVTTGSLPVNTASTDPTSGSYLTFTVTGTATTVATINNTATIAIVSGNDPVTANNSSQASTTVTAPGAITADPAVKEARFTIVPDLPTIFRGQSGTQLVTITNQGPDAATGTVANFKLRPQNGVTVTSVKVVGGASCTLSAGEWSCPVGSVSNGANFQLQVSYDTTSSATLGTAIQADIRVGSNEFNPGSGVGESLYNVWGSTNPNGSTQFNEIRPNGAFALAYGTSNANENTNLSAAWLPSQGNPTGAYLTQAVIGGNNSVFGSVSTYGPMINRILTSLNNDAIAKSQTLLALDPATQAGDNRRAWQLTTGIFVPANTTASLCVGTSGGQLDDSAYIMLNGNKVGNDGNFNGGSAFIQNSVALNPGYNRVTYRIANRNTPGNNEDYAQGLYGEIGLSINGGACNAANLDATASLQIPASINIIDKPVVTISGRVFEDNSGTTTINSNAYNGTQEAGEVGIAGSQVSLTNCSSTTVATTQTTANGDYQFSVATTDVPAGNFCIAQTNLTGYSSVSGSTGYTRATDIITVANTGATSYSGRNFGDARLSLLLTEDGQQTITAGGAADYPHRLTAQSVLNITAINQTATQQPASSTDSSWQTVLYRDTNCNGKVDSGEVRVSTTLPITLKAAEQICLVQRVYAPANASMGAQHNAQLQASFSVTLADNSQITGTSASRQDTTLLGSAGLSMQKGVRTVASCPSTASDTGSFVTQNQAQSGNYLEYEITYRNNSSKNLVNVSIKDSIPSGTVYQSIVCSVNPGLSCTPSHTNGTLLWQTNGTLSPNQQGKVRFCVQVP